jgi:hypothetical protein
MIKLAKERRVQKRKQISLPVFYSYMSEYDHVYDNGTTFDLSDSGICFYTHTPLLKGHPIQVLISDVWDSPKSGIVQWCSMKNLNFYKIGVHLQ